MKGRWILETRTYFCSKKLTNEKKEFFIARACKIQWVPFERTTLQA
jgi:hypothetical protein